VNRLKSAFRANMSHEIRTLLTSIIGFADVLQDRNPDASGENIADFIGQSSERLLWTLNSVLDLSKLEAQALRLSSEPFDMAEVVRDTVSLFQQRVESSDVSLEADADGPIRVSLDAAAMKRILDKLIGNALKFTKQGTTHVSAQRTTASKAVEMEAPTTETTDAEASDAQPSQAEDSNRSEHVVLQVADTGPSGWIEPSTWIAMSLP